MTHRWPPLMLLLTSVAMAQIADDAWTQALTRGDIATIEKLTAQGADVNRTTADGRTGLMLAASERHGPLVRALMMRGAKVNAANKRGGTALMFAATAGDLDVVELLLAHAAAVNTRAANGWTALTLASTSGHEAVVRALLAHGADPNLADIYRWTPLMRAVEQNRVDVVRVLLAATRLNIDARDEHGNTALHHAAVRGSIDIARMLVTQGADTGLRNRAGLSAAKIATAQGHKAVAELLGAVAPR